MKTKRPQIVRALIGEYHVNRFFPDVESAVQRWLIGPEHEELKNKALELQWEEMEVPEYNARKSYEAVMRKLSAAQTKKVIPLKRLIVRVAAVIVPLLVLGTVAVMRWTASEPPRIAYSVPWGERGELALPDGSRLWVNAGSTVSYPEKFARKKREITLEGEAYFEVASDVKRPFVVTAEGLSIAVTGTEFNIRAFPGQEQLAVTVARGSVAVTTPDRTVHPLAPDRQLAYNIETGRSVVSEVDASLLSGWRAGKLVFDAQSFDDMVGQLQMYYGVPFRIDGPLRIPGRYTIQFDPGSPVGEVLEILTYLVGDFEYDISPQEVRIYAQ